ncbi:uncharacterized protein BDR25DRAFT_345980 [Lindgomyces ingoldianus]|uniref:Uncharacterized protein n=1 Tax=Lindgomyces ingoldianus TaxID=673940 RepID=A0ACB6QFX2_9PLEO|nr:uncharacterized protein BDR25DRAFT_345980 [Lindgomyces ingoldianus]KAF2465400.1 hypothetical protein BDR25DRAFT_345980 [Lindgomyces ingoldianus]
MARKQATKSRPTTVVKQLQVSKQKTSTATIETSTDQAVDVKQSTELVQTLVHAAVSSLAFLRHLFGEHCFDDQLYEVDTSKQTYEDYANGLNQAQDKPGVSRFRVLKRGRSERVDQLLDWLEKGAFDALKRNILHGLQLSIFEDPKQPSNVVELYTFTFHYTISNQGSRTLSGMEVAGPGGKKITVKTAKLAMHTLIRQVVLLCGTMPALPRSRFVRMHLFYTDDRPEQYEPPGFQKAAGTCIFFPNANWKTTSSTCGPMDAGFHKVSLKISHILPSDSSAGDQEQFTIPQKLTYTKLARREDDIVADSKARQSGLTQSTGEVLEQGQPLHGGFLEVERLQQKSAIPMAQASLPKPGEADIHSLNDASSPTSSCSSEEDLDIILKSTQVNSRLLINTSTLGETQPVQEAEVPVDNEGLGLLGESSKTVAPSLRPEDLRIKERLQRMLNPPNQEHDTQDTLKQVESIHKLLVAGGPSQQIQLSQTKIRQLESRRSNLLPPRRRATNLRRRSQSLGTGSEGDVIKCQCGHDEEEDDMINCSFCDTWQHLHCYGYRGSEDQRIPAVHACYDCLLQGKEHELLRELRYLALCRRGIRFLEAHDVTNDKELANILHCDLQTASGMANHFRKEKYLVSTSGPKKASSGKRFSLNKANRVVVLMMKEYFDPLSKIAHHINPVRLQFELPLAQSVAQQPTNGAAGSPEGASVGRRYVFRQRTDSQMAQADGDSTAQRTTAFTRKRDRSGENTAEAMTPKRLRPSESMAVLNAGDPSPMR